MLWRRANNYTFTTTTHARRALSWNKKKKKNEFGGFRRALDLISVLYL